MGDIIYALPAIKAVGPGALYLSPGLAFGSEQIDFMLPLLCEQPYLAKVALHRGEAVEVDLDAFRRQDVEHTNLADCHLALLGLDKSWRDEPWLHVTPVPLSAGTVLFSRSMHHTGIDGFWEECARVFAGRSLFVGVPAEHEYFGAHYGDIPYLSVANLLELARLIAGCSFFVGNQSCPYALAEGLKRPAILQEFPASPNCNFGRESAFTVREQQDITMINPWASRFFP